MPLCPFADHQFIRTLRPVTDSALNPRGLLHALTLIVMLPLALSAATTPGTPETATWADWIEPDFPFYSSTVDARQSGGSSPTNNLTPRALVLNLGHETWAAFDTELLRIAAVWRGKGTTPVSLATGSYHDAGWKTREGQEQLPEPSGRVWLANGVYAGWQSGEDPSLADPRAAGPSPEEIGRGPLPRDRGRFVSIRHTRSGAVLSYEVNGTRIEERLTAHEGGAVTRTFRVAPSSTPLLLLAGLKGGTAAAPSLQIRLEGDHARLQPDDGLWLIRLAPHESPTTFALTVGENPGSGTLVARAHFPSEADLPAGSRWTHTVTTQGKLADTTGAYVVDDIGLPVPNPWRRNVRLADLQFFRSGRAALLTFDGDVWLVDGLQGNLGQVTWRRFASGLHEPQSCVIREDELFVFDRNGIWRLRDTDANGEADVHELFSNAFTQTAETREFANSMKLAPDGSFVISKGGQTGTTIGRHNTTVLRISADGQTATVLGTGLRQAFVGVHPKTGLVTASDQQGHYVPATPLHIVADGAYYGFLSKLQPAEKYPAPIADPLVWLPHQVNPSGMSQVWLTDAAMGPLNDALIHIGYNRPELFRVLLDRRSTKPQAAVVSLSRDFAFPTMNGAVNPVDRQLYVTGFQVWGTTAGRLSGLARVRYTGQPSLLPAEVVAMDQGVMLRFDVELDDSATDPSRYLIERWNYRRTAQYGSPHYKLDGSLGQELMPMGSVHLSPDRKQIFIGLPDMRAGVMQLRVGWTLRTAGGIDFDNNAYLTPYELAAFNAEAEGFGPIAVDLTPKHVPSGQAPVLASVTEGRRLYEFFGCMACHTVDGVRSFGPAFKGLAGKARPLADDTIVEADRAYLRESILNPGAKVVKGFESAMPTYAGILSDAQIESLILYIESVR